MRSKSPQLVIVGSIGIDTIETPHARREEILGGSVSYACMAASFFTRPGMVGVVGTDFPAEYRTAWKKAGIDLAGLQTEQGRTFRWSGVYEQNMDSRSTLSTELNVFENFSPEIPDSYRAAPYLLLANIAPELQLHVLDQMTAPEFILLDTMDLWINSARPKLLEVIARCTMLTVNESEARLLADTNSLLTAAQRLLKLGPHYVLIKKGSAGSMLVSDNGIFLLHAFPPEMVKDPTGAGDTFAGGLMGALAEAGKIDEKSIRQAMAYGSVIAAFGVEEFSQQRLEEINRRQIDQRMDLFKSMVAL
ncbi:MAG: PfkB family carbohydrate kinase [Kiritimatiellales bacterium]